MSKKSAQKKHVILYTLQGTNISPLKVGYVSSQEGTSQNKAKKGHEGAVLSAVHSPGMAGPQQKESKGQVSKPGRKL